MVYIFILIFNKSILDRAKSTDQLSLLPLELSMLDKKKGKISFLFLGLLFISVKFFVFLLTSCFIKYFVTRKKDKVTLGQGSLYSHAMKMTGELEK